MEPSHQQQPLQPRYGDNLSQMESEFVEMSLGEKASRSIASFSLLPPEVIRQIWTESNMTAIVSRGLLPFSLEQLYSFVTINRIPQLAAFARTVKSSSVGDLVKSLSFAPTDHHNWHSLTSPLISLEGFNALFNSLPSLRELTIDFFPNAVQILRQTEYKRPRMFPKLETLSLTFANGQEAMSLELWLYEGLNNIPNFKTLEIMTGREKNEPIWKLPPQSKLNVSITELNIDIRSRSACGALSDFLPFFLKLDTLMILFASHLSIRPAKILQGVNKKLKQLELVELPGLRSNRKATNIDPLESSIIKRFSTLASLTISPTVYSDGLFVSLKDLPLECLRLQDATAFPPEKVLEVLSGPHQIPTLQELVLLHHASTLAELAQDRNFKQDPPTPSTWAPKWNIIWALRIVKMGSQEQVAISGSVKRAFVGELCSGRSKAEWRAYEDEVFGKEKEGEEVEEEVADEDEEIELVRITGWAIGRMSRRFDAAADKSVTE